MCMCVSIAISVGSTHTILNILCGSLWHKLTSLQLSDPLKCTASLSFEASGFVPAKSTHAFNA